MSGTNKAILSMCVLLLTAMVVYYGMTPPSQQQSTAIDLPMPPQPSGPGEGSPATSDSVISGKKMDFLVVVAEPSTEDVSENDETVEIEVIESDSPAVVKAQEFKIYTVREGDSLSRIAANILKKESRWRELQDWNNIADENVGDLQIGQVIKYIPNS